MIDRAVAAAAGVLCLVLTAFLLIQTGKLHNAERRADRAELTLSKERESAATQLAHLTQKARETEQSLTANAAQIEGEKNAQITALDSRAAALTRRLRDQAATSRLVSATGTTASVGEVAAVCDRGGLSDRAGTDLVGLVVRADKIRLQLAACEAQYDGARAALSQ